MAFVTTVIGSQTGAHNAYNIDFSVGAVKRNMPTDVQLVQALFRLVHFELSKPVAPPPGETGIVVDGLFGPRTLRFILNWQRQAISDGIKVLLDGSLDPFRKQNELSHVAHVRYALELLSITCNNLCLDEGLDNFRNLPKRDDIPPALKGELNLPNRSVARQYQQPGL